MTHLTFFAALTLALLPSMSFAHGGGKKVKLHVNPKWKQCSFQLDSSLTQHAWREFTQEAGLVAYFRPLSDARPLGVGNYEVSILQWTTGIDESKDAWNNTFVHPDSTHWLTGGEPLVFPGLMFRTGVTERLDVGAYWTRSPGANYGFWGGHVQYNLANETSGMLTAATRLSFISLYGPKDLDLTVYGADVLVSKKFAVWKRFASISPYVGASVYLSDAHEKTAAVDLHDETVVGLQGMVGAVAQISIARLAVEYNMARIRSLSFKIGVSF